MDVAGKANPDSKPGACLPACLVGLSRQPALQYCSQLCWREYGREHHSASIFSPSSTVSRVTARCHLSLVLRVLVPAACDSRVSSAAAFSRALTAWACVVCICPVILCSSFSTITSTLGGGVKVSSSACRYRESPPASRCRFRLDLPPAPVESRSAAVDNPHFIPTTRPRPRYLSCGFRHIAPTFA